MTNPLRDIPKYIKSFQVYLGWKIYLFFALTLFAVISEGVGILMLLPLLQTLDSKGLKSVESINDSDNLSLYLHQVISFFDVNKSIESILIVITLFFILKGVLSFSALSVNAYLKGKLLYKLKTIVFDSYKNMSYGYYSNKDAGHFTNIINEQATNSVLSFHHLTRFISKTISSLIYIIFAFFVSWKFGLMAFVFGIVVLLLFKKLSNYVRELSRKRADESGILSKLVIQAIHGFKYLTATSQMDKVQNNVEVSVKKLTQYSIKTGIATAFTGSIREPIAVVFIIGVIFFQLIILQEQLSPILVSIVLFYRGLNSILIIQSSWQTTLESIGSMELLHNELSFLQKNKDSSGSIIASKIDSDILFKMVRFKYDRGPDYALDNINIDILPKKTIAFVGGSGAGKSTLVDLITLLIKPSSGEIFINNTDSSSICKSVWRSHLGYVSQDAVIFNDSIANNISMNLGGGDYPDKDQYEKVISAAKQAYISDFIEALPDGYNTKVGDRGVKLSGGQKQRIVIARELFRDPHILILDEATSSLDSRSESFIQKSVDKLKGRVTVIIIAHRLSTIKNVDHVFVLEKGRLVEEGEFDKLRNDKSSRLRNMIDLQAI